MSAPLPAFTPDVASQIAKADPILNANKEPGFANTYGPGSNTPEGQFLTLLPPAGIGALSLYLLYRKRQEDLQAQKEQEKIAKLDVASIQAQLPGLHAPDLLLGGAAGAGAGALYDYLRGSPKGKKFRTLLQRILAGAAIGAGATNFAGDRLRRYVSNSMLPFGYEDGILSQLKPRSMEHLRDALVYDKPSFDPKLLKQISDKYNNNSGVVNDIVNARRELMRIAMGIDKHNPETSIWQKNVGQNGPAHYSLNEKNPAHLRHLFSLMMPQTNATGFSYPAKAIDPSLPDVSFDALSQPSSAYPYEKFKQFVPQAPHTPQQYQLDPNLQHGVDLSKFFTNPQEAVREYNRTDVPPTDVQNYLKKWHVADLFGTNSLLGGQQIITRPNGENIEGMALDRYDVTPTRGDYRGFLDDLRNGRFLSPAWREQPRSSADGYANGQTNAKAFNSMLGRITLNSLLSRENPWVSQRFNFAPMPGGEYGLQFQRQDGTPVTPPMGADAFNDYIGNLRGNAQ